MAGDGSLSTAHFVDQGILCYLGYRIVQTQGVSKYVRELILDEIFTYALPPLNSLEYMEGWGSPESPRRLEKMARFIASFLQNIKKRNRLI